MRGYKNTILRVLNLALFLSGCLLAGTGLMLAYRMPHGGGGGRAQVLGFTRHEWGDLHLVLGITVVLLSIAHLVQNWTWMRKIAARSRVWPLAAGLLVGALLLFGPLLLPVETAQGGGQGYQRRGAETDMIGDVDPRQDAPAGASDIR